MDIHQLRRRNEELSILNAIAQELNRELSLEKAMQSTLERVVALMSLRTGWIWLFTPEGDAAYVAASYQLPPVFYQSPELLTGTCYCIEKYRADDLDSAANISEITCSRLKNLTDGTEGLRYHASVPLFSSGKKVGILNVLSVQSQQLSTDKLQLLYTIGDMLGIAIERARLFGQSHQMGIIEERNRLARELHDTLAQDLTAISLKLETLSALWGSKDDNKLQQLLQETQSLTRNSLEEARRSVLDLRATPLEGHRLIEALEQLLQQGEAEGQLQGTFEVLGTYRPLSMRQEMGLYRIVQEAINNVIKHAEAKQLLLELSYQDETLLLSIQDDGCGFDPEAEPEGAFGLQGISERVKLLGGQLDLQSSPDLGTLVQINIPLSR
ncbi:MAG: GAF domain-containing sensor histidine kinase [Bacteroidota bacterium]